jgi:methionyl-tRNA formyltransferase
MIYKYQMNDLFFRPKVVILTTDGLYSRLFIQQFLATNLIQVVGVIESTAYLKRGSRRLQDGWNFLRTVGIFYALYQVFVCWAFPYIKRFSKKSSDYTFRTNDVNSPEAVTLLKSLAPDFILSVHFNQKILLSVIQIPTIATLNFHPSLLPQWRGVDPVLFALQNLNSSTTPAMGFSIHLVADQIDAGDLLLQKDLQDTSATGLIKINSSLFAEGGSIAAHVIAHFDDFYGSRIPQASLGSGCYDGWDAVGKLGFSGLKKALCAIPRTAS